MQQGKTRKWASPKGESDRVRTAHSSLEIDGARDALDDWINASSANGDTPRTLENKRWIVGKFLDFCEDKGLKTVNKRSIEAWLADANGRGCGKATLRTYHSKMHAWCGWMVSDGILPKSPMADIKAPRVPRNQPVPFTPAEVGALYKAAKDSDLHHRDVAVLSLFLDTGIRAGELCALRRRDVDLEGGKITIVDGKGEKTRTVWFGESTKQALKAYKRRVDTHRPRSTGRKMQLTDDDPFFLSERERKSPGVKTGLTTSGLRRMMLRLRERSGVASVHPHKFRHTYGISYLRAGANAYDVQHDLGHETMTQTMQYVHVAEHDREVHKRMYSPVDAMRRK